MKDSYENIVFNKNVFEQDLGEITTRKIFGNKDLITLSDIIGILEELQTEVERLEEENEELRTPSDYDPNVEVPHIHGPGISW